MPSRVGGRQWPAHARSGNRTKIVQIFLHGKSCASCKCSLRTTYRRILQISEASHDMYVHIICREKRSTRTGMHERVTCVRVTDVSIHAYSHTQTCVAPMSVGCKLLCMNHISSANKWSGGNSEKCDGIPETHTYHRRARPNSLPLSCNTSILTQGACVTMTRTRIWIYLLPDTIAGISCGQHRQCYHRTLLTPQLVSATTKCCTHA